MFRFFTSSYRFGLMSFQPERHAGQGHRAAVSPRRIRRGRDFGGRPFRHPSRRPLNTGEVSAARRPYYAGVNSYFELGFKKAAASRSATGAHPHAVCIHWRRKATQHLRSPTRGLQSHLDFIPVSKVRLAPEMP